MAVQHNWLDRSIGFFAPRLQLQRTRARIATELMLRHYEGAAAGRRSQGWRIGTGDANAVIGPSLVRLREVARDLERNNPYAESALATIADHTVGWEIKARPVPANADVAARWKAWAYTTDCDADGQHDLAGLCKLVMRTVARDGECLARRRRRLVTDGYALPFQIQVLEPDFLDHNKTMALPGGGQILQGVEFDAIGTRVAYWLFPSHPGSASGFSSQLLSPSRRVTAADIRHVFKATRAGQVRATSWFGPEILRMKDFDEYEDATLMKQKIAACLAVITSDVDGTAGPLGSADDSAKATNPKALEIDTISPGSIINAAAGRSIEVVQPPSVREHAEYSLVTLRAIAAGLGLTYEDFTGDFSNVNFSSARMARLKHWSRVEDWRWRMLIPQLLDPVWDWAMEAMAILGLPTSQNALWSPPPMPMIEPEKEGLALMRNIRIGAQTWPDAIRERGNDPDEQLAEIQAWNKKLDDAGVILDCDSRYSTQAGQLQGEQAPNNAA